MIQKDKIKAALEGKTLIHGEMWDLRQGCGCVLGTLCVEAGASPKHVANEAYPTFFNKLAGLLEDEYGLRYDDRDILIRINDSYDDEVRKEAILKTLDAL